MASVPNPAARTETYTSWRIKPEETRVGPDSRKLQDKGLRPPPGILVNTISKAPQWGWMLSHRKFGMSSWKLYFC